MRRALIILAAIVGSLVVIAGGIYVTGNTLPVLAFIFKPHHGWDPALKAPAPNYGDAKNWAATPENPGFTSYRPKGTPPPATAPAVDVFFVHPTGDMNGADWNSSLATGTR